MAEAGKKTSKTKIAPAKKRSSSPSPKSTEHLRKDLPILSFPSEKKFEVWMKKSYATSTGIFLRLYKKASGVSSIVYAEALDVALCYGWIDGLKLSHDNISFLQKFSPRRAKSVWSKRNVEHVSRLEKEDRIQESGRKQIEAAKADGRWQNAYDTPANTKVPTEFLKRLEKNKKAKAFFDTLNKTNTFMIAVQVTSAKKPETKERRIVKILEMLASGKKFY
jgi:uncharacterized protein YdeI (YjbR/CyaY-like superfamily)